MNLQFKLIGFFTPMMIAFLMSTAAHADILKDFDTLGGNDVLINRAKQLQPDKDVKIVQNRVVDRRWRNEFSGGYANVLGGDAYLQTQMLNLDYHLHISPYWSVGLGYYSAFNKLSREGRHLLNTDGLIPDVDEPQSGYELSVNFSPIYGKINLLNVGVMQFDIYAIGTYGKIMLNSGETDSYTVGAGFGLWISQHLTSRLELRQRFYEARRLGGTVDVDTTIASFSFGYML